MNAYSLPHGTAGAGRPVVLRAEGLSLAFAGASLFENLSFTVPAGLTFLRGGEGRGKTTLLRILAGEQRPDAGRVERAPSAGSAPSPDGTFWDPPPDDPQAALTARQWLRALGERLPGGDADRLNDLIEDFDLGPQLDKALFMLSTGTRRKVWLAGAFGAGARLTLLEKPFAALDARARGVLAEQLQDVVGDPCRAWVVADYEWPAALSGLQGVHRIDLGD